MRPGWHFASLLGAPFVALVWTGSVRAEPPDSAASEAEVQVEGSGGRRSTRDASAASTVIDRQQLTEPGIDAARLLGRVPGAQTTRTGTSTDLATVSLRGSTAAEVPVYLAGVRLQDELTGVSDLSRLPLWMIERIEVYRGSTPDFVGRSGMGGAIWLEPRRPTGTEGRAGLEVGSWDSQAFWAGASVSNREPAERTRRGVIASSSLGFKGSRAVNDYTYRDDAGTAFNPRDDREVRRQNADQASNDVWSLSRFEVPTSSGPLVTDVVLNGFAREQGVTSLSQLQAQRARLSIERMLLGLTSRVPCGGSLEDCSVTVSTRANGQSQVTLDPWRELGLGTDQLALSSQRLENRVSWRARASEILRYGADLSFETGRLRLDQPGLPRTRAGETILSAAGLVGLDLGPTESVFVARGNCLDVRGSEFERATQVNDCFFEGRWGSRLRVTDSLSVRANLSRAVRPATLGERYGVSATARGNPTLAPESGTGADLGVAWTGRPAPWISLDGELFGFARWAEDLIAYRRSALGYVRPYNVRDSRTLGLEAAAHADLFRHLALRGQLTALDPRDTSAERSLENDLIPLLSRLVFTSEMEIHADDLAGVDRAWLALLLRYRGGRVADPAGLVVIPEQLITDLSAGMLYFRRHVAFRARLENLFDVQQFDTVGFPLPGRSVYASLELTY